MTLLEKVKFFFKKRTEKLPEVTAKSSIAAIETKFPRFEEFAKQRYGISLSERDRTASLGSWVKFHSLPSPQIVFMEMQLYHRGKGYEEMSAKQLAARLTELTVIDVRESWERPMGSLPGAKVLDEALWEEMLKQWPRDRPIALYCHFGIRSADAGGYLAQQGFQEIYVLKGGIDAWSKEIDPTIPQYDQAWC